jgi:hypothetical protein
VIIEVCPEGYIDGPSLNITLNRRDMRSKFGYIALYEMLGRLTLIVKHMYIKIVKLTN